MIDETTPGAGPDETAAPETAPEQPVTPAADAPPSPETPSADAGTTEPPSSPEAPVDEEPEAEQPFAHGGDQVAAQIADDQAQGFHGQEVDQTLNEDYTAPQGGDAEEPTTESTEGTDAA